MPFVWGVLYVTSRLYIFIWAYCRAKEIKHSGPNIGKKVVKKSSVVSHSVQSSQTPPLVPARPRGRPPKNSYMEKPTTDVDSAKKKSDGPISDNSSSATDNFPLR